MQITFLEFVIWFFLVFVVSIPLGIWYGKSKEDNNK